MRKRFLLMLMLTLGVAGCGPLTMFNTPQVYYPSNAFEEYNFRSDKITASAGNVQEVNTRLQVYDPWPPHSDNPQIPVSGERMVGAVERYRDVSKQRQEPPPLPIVGTQNTGGTSSGGAH